MKRIFAVILICSGISGSVLAEESPKSSTNLNLDYERSNPVLAGALSIIPGLGQVYNEDYFVGALWFTAEVGLYLTAFAYNGAFSSKRAETLSYESLVVFALAGGLHLLSIFDATLESIRRNENLDRWSVAIDPQEGKFGIAYCARF